MTKESTLNVWFLQQGVRLSSVTTTFGWGGGIPSLKGLPSIGNTNQIRALLVLLVAEVTYPHHFYKLIANCVIACKIGTLWSDNGDVHEKPRWKIASASFQIISRLSQVAQLLKRREFMLELKRGGRTRVQTEMVEFIAFPFQSSKKL